MAEKDCFRFAADVLRLKGAVRRVCQRNTFSAGR